MRTLLGLVVMTGAAYAAVPASGPRVTAETLTALPAANVTKPLRLQEHVLWGQSTPPLAWSAFVGGHGGTWQAAWDAATGVPTRIWGSGIPVPGSIVHADIAERFARQFLADQIGLLAPGAAATDFVLVSNHFDGKIRSIGFTQHVGGRRVVGGQVSFRFEADRLVVIGTEALPHVTFSAPRVKLGATTLVQRATKSLRSQLLLPNAPVSSLGEEVILPLVGEDAVLGYRLARTATIDGGADGRYLGYIDIATGEAIAVRQLNTYATGTVLYHAVDRYPGRGRIDLPAPRTFVTVNGAGQTTTAAGVVSWSPDTDATVATSISGDLVTVVNKAADPTAATATLGLSPSGSMVWDASGAEQSDAQVNTFICVGIAKEYARANIDAAMPTIDEQMVANVNIAQNCNAFFDGKAVNFYQSSTQCQNTALISDVIYHEYGHRVHTAEIIEGVGDFDGAMSEGAADFLASSITGDHGMGRGFYYTDNALRDLDPDGMEWMWPTDIGEIHHTGMIFGGVFWDLRKALIAELGDTAGIALTNKLYVATLRRAINIPTGLVEALLADDDDGNLSNGTPHECEIRNAWGRHGIRTATGSIVAPGHLELNALAIGVRINVVGLSERCGGDEVVGAHLDWVPPYSGVPNAGSVDATPAGGDTFFAQLPLSPQDSVSYKARIDFADGSTLTLADNMADRYYQLYQGPTVNLYCTDFESTDPFSDGWTTGIDDLDTTNWEWGVPTGGATDPHAAFSGTHILAQVLNGDYTPKQRSWVKMPPIDIGQYSDVRLQYRRWLASEDSHFDQAKITANDKKAWINFTADMGDSSSTHHVDKEWRFHDVPLSSHFTGHTVTVGFEITSDEGLELGGWQLDDVCIVANPYSICGDGVKNPYEQCDNGAANKDAPDVCHTDCRLPTCGDSFVDSQEECDDGAMGSTTCSDKCMHIDDGGGCCSSSGGRGSVALAALCGMLLLRRRRRCRPRSSD